MSTADRSAFLPVATAATAAALWVTPATVQAQPVWASSGVAFSVSLGRQIEVGVALDLRLTVSVGDKLVSLCSDLSMPGGLGLYGQAAWYSRTGWRFGAGLHGGGSLVDWPASFDGELGWSYRRRLPPGSLAPTAATAAAVPTPPATPLASVPPQTVPSADPDDEVPGQGAPKSRAAPVPLHTGSHGLHLGFIAQATPLELFLLGFQLPLGLDLPLSNVARGPFFTTGFGIRFPGTFGLPRSPCTIVIGRPLRENGEVVLPDVQVGEPCARHELDDRLASALATAWLDDARAECASIPVFFALARDLAALSAPPELIARALTAAAEELDHTVLCSRLAARFSGGFMWPIVPDVPALKDANREAALCRLASEAWLDGCLGEGAAAAQARCAHMGASDDEVCHTLAVIARDEAGHAELAWSVLAFCLRVGGRSVYEAVAALVHASLEPPECIAIGTVSPSGPRPQDAAGLRSFGRVPLPVIRTLWLQNAARARLRVLRLLRHPERQLPENPARPRRLQSATAATLS